MSCKLFVGNLPYSVTSERLQEAFSQFGTVSSSKVIVDRETGRSRGFAFLEMETDDQGAAAMQAMNGALLDGRSIAVREAVERQPGGGGGGLAAAAVVAATAAASVRAARVRPMAAAAVVIAAAVAAATAAAVAVAIAAAVVAAATAAVAAAAAIAARPPALAAVLAMAARCATGAPISPAVLRRRAAVSTAAAPKSPGRSGVTAAVRPTVRGGSVITSRASAGSTTINRP